MGTMSSPAACSPLHLLILGLAAFISGYYHLILDCDETFNYLEPLHFLRTGHGFQTWEWAPQFALRPYLYLLLYRITGLLLYPFVLILDAIVPLPIFISRTYAELLAVRLIWSFVSMYAHKSLINVLLGPLPLTRPQSPTIAFSTTALVIGMGFAPGFFISRAAILPNSFSAILFTWGLAYWLRGRDHAFLILLSVATIVGWTYTLPFAIIPAFLSLNPRYSKLFHNHGSLWKVFEATIRRLLVTGIFATIYILGPTILVDYIFYGRFLISPLNTLVYNLFSNQGPNLYGTESWSFYLKNLCLNFNLFFPLALLSLPICLLAKERLMMLFSISLIKTLAIFSLQPHKEERFLFPLYPILVICASYTLARFKRSIQCVMIGLFVLLSLSRSIALIRYYGGPQKAFEQMEFKATDTLCLGDSWYRFPSHFYLNEPRIAVGFVKTATDHGLLPQYYKSTSAIPKGFNGQNKSFPGQFTPLNQCTLIAGLERELEQYQTQSLPSNLICYPIINPDKTPLPYRWLYIPILSNANTVYDRFCIQSVDREMEL